MQNTDSRFLEHYKENPGGHKKVKFRTNKWKYYIAQLVISLRTSENTETENTVTYTGVKFMVIDSDSFVLASIFYFPKCYKYQEKSLKTCFYESTKYRQF